MSWRSTLHVFCRRPCSDGRPARLISGLEVPSPERLDRCSHAQTPHGIPLGHVALGSHEPAIFHLEERDGYDPFSAILSPPPPPKGSHPIQNIYLSRLSERLDPVMIFCEEHSQVIVGLLLSRWWHERRTGDNSSTAHPLLHCSSTTPQPSPSAWLRRKTPPSPHRRSQRLLTMAWLLPLQTQPIASQPKIIIKKAEGMYQDGIPGWMANIRRDETRGLHSPVRKVGGRYTHLRCFSSILSFSYPAGSRGELHDLSCSGFGSTDKEIPSVALHGGYTLTKGAKVRRRRRLLGTRNSRAHSRHHRHHHHPSRGMARREKKDIVGSQTT